MEIKLGKPVFLCLHGPSLQKLDDQIERFANADVYWATVNSSAGIEGILQKIDKKLDFLCVGNNRQISRDRDSISDFLFRPDTLFFTTTRGAMEFPKLSWDYFQ